MKKEAGKMNKGLKKFFIICAAAVCMGLILSVVGYVTGGIHFMDKLSEKYTWFRGGEMWKGHIQV